MIKRGLSLKLACLVLGFTLLILGIILAYNYSVSREIITKQAKTQAVTLADNTANQIGSKLLPIQKVVQNTALAMEDENLTSDEIKALVKRVMKNSPEVFGMAIAFEPYLMDPEQLYFCPYFYRENGSLRGMMLGNSEYRYLYMDWYQLPKELKQPVWTEPYFDDGGGNMLMTTYAVPFYRTVNGKRVFAGVATADITLDWLEELVSGIKLYDTGYAVVISRNGTYVVHAIDNLVLNHTIFSLAEKMGDPEIRTIGRSMVAGETGFVRRKSVKGSVDSFLYYRPLPIGGWSLGILYPRDEVLAGVFQLSKEMFGMAAVGIILLTFVVIWISRRITHPLRKLATVAEQVAAGDLDSEVPAIDSKDEVSALADAFVNMQKSLKQYIEDLTATTASKERIESELRIAREIQMGILPKLFPAFPEKQEFDIYASIEPAKEVGGDLYDFFFIDDDHFCFLIGDVSGKGVPAAFFMAVTKTLLKVVAERGLDPGEILSKVNDDLAEENESCMFVTLFLSILNIRTGEVRYGSAGHNPPVFVHSDGIEWIPPSREPVCGVMEGMIYSSETLTMKPGDTIFLYTDGVSEAMNNEKTLYSDERLMRNVTRFGRNGAKELVLAMDESIKVFAEGAEQSDDITMLAMQYNAPPKDNDANTEISN